MSDLDTITRAIMQLERHRETAESDAEAAKDAYGAGFGNGQEDAFQTAINLLRELQQKEAA